MYECWLCGKKFEKSTSHAAHVRNHLWNVKMPRIKVNKICLGCGKEFIVERILNKDKTQRISKKEKKYCCKSCANARGKNLERISHKCPICGKKSFKEFCSRKCRTLNDHKILIEMAKERNSFVGITTKPGTVRMLLLEHYGHQCQECKISTWQDQPVPLIMDHIDGDSDNWNFDNLRLLCRNCDGLLPTYAGRNVGKTVHQTKRMKKQSENIKKGNYKFRVVK